MARKGLTKEGIVDAAVTLIEERGNHAFSLNELARALGIKPASLYNHIDNAEALIGAVGFRIGRMIREAEMQAIAGKHRDDALLALCDAYRTFAWEHVDLYKVIMGMQRDKNAFTEQACGEMIAPILEVLSDFRIPEPEKIHWQRILRAMMHGFITHEFAGGFCHDSAEEDETYRKAVQTVILGLCNAEKEQEQ